MNLGDTIVAVSTPAGAGVRAIVRLSGRRAIDIAERVFTPDGGDDVVDECSRELARAAGVPLAACSQCTPERALADKPPVAPAPDRSTRESELAARIAELPSFTALAGTVVLTDEHMHIPATIYLMRRPRSYTREDVVELHVGAWPAVVPLVVAALVEAGARPAEPGEFTLRALLAGRLDLAQAEAVMAVVGAGSRAALRAAGEMLAGHLSREVVRLIGRLREALTVVEADLDFSDQNIGITPPSEIADRLAAVRRDLADLGRRSRGIETASGDVRLVIAGRPGAGKSSLFNRLLASDRAIVAPAAGPLPAAGPRPTGGTTRDELRSTLHAGGLTFALSDVAGIETDCGLRIADCGLNRGDGAPEAQGEGGGGIDGVRQKARAKAIEAIGRADLVILAVEANASSYDDIDEFLAPVAAPTVVAITKCDLAPPDRATRALEAGGFAAEAVVATSAATGQGVEELREALVRTVEGGAVDREAVGPVMTARHRAAMGHAAAALARAARIARRPGSARPGPGSAVAEPGLAGELVAMELRDALDALGAIVGRQTPTDVLDEIFARFCIGK